MNDDQKIVVLTTASNRTEAKKIAQALLQKKLAACVQMIPTMESFFWWKEKIQHEKEILVLIKTKQSVFKSLCETIKKNHSYQVPEVVAIPLTAGSQEYFKWMDTVITKSS